MHPCLPFLRPLFALLLENKVITQEVIALYPPDTPTVTKPYEYPRRPFSHRPQGYAISQENAHDGHVVNANPQLEHQGEGIEGMNLDLKP